MCQELPRCQSAKGFGDFFRSLLRRIHPIALKGATTALTRMRDSQVQGASFQESLKSALDPTTKAAIYSTSSPMEKEEKQRGSGRKRGRMHKTVYKGAKATNTAHYLQL